MENKTCCIFNYAAHYREPIYRLIDKELHAHFFIGDKLKTSIKKMDYNELVGFKKELENIKFGKHFYWQKGSIRTIFSDYKHYIITGEPHCISTWILLFLARFSSKKTFLWTHGWYGRESKKKKFIKKIFFGLSNYVLLYGDYARQLMITEGFKPQKLKCIYNSLDYDTQLHIRENLKESDLFLTKFKNNYPVLCYVGRIQKVKRLDLIIDALNILKNNFNLHLNIVIVGEDKENTDIQNYAIKSGLSENLWFYGPCYEEQKLAEIFYNSTICISPGNVGLTAIHSLTYGCPVITHNNFKNQGPEFESIVDGITGTFFKENDSNDLARKMIEWLTMNDHIRQQIRLECFKIIESKYNPYYQINALKNVLNESAAN